MAHVCEDEQHGLGRGVHHRRCPRCPVGHDFLDFALLAAFAEGMKCVIEVCTIGRCERIEIVVRVAAHAPRETVLPYVSAVRERKALFRRRSSSTKLRYNSTVLSRYSRTAKRRKTCRIAAESIELVDEADVLGPVAHPWMTSGTERRSASANTEVVGRLVEQQHVAAAAQHLGEMHAVALAAGELADLLLLVRRRGS